jgi:hypothetical protein
MITFSANESNVLGVSIGRGSLTESWQVNDLAQEILQGGYDFIRLKMPSSDEEVFQKLEQLGMPYRLHSILVRNTIEIKPEHVLKAPQQIQFELYDGTYPDELMQLVRASYGERTSVNYHNPYFRCWVSYEAEMAAAAAYATEFVFADNAKMPNWVIKKEGHNIGFVLGVISEGNLEGMMYSILPAFRGYNYAAAVMAFLKSWCWQNGVKTFSNNVPLQNLPSLKNIVSQAILPVDSLLNVTVSSMLLVSFEDAIAYPVEGFASRLILLHWILSTVGGVNKTNETIANIRVNIAECHLPSIDEVLLTKPMEGHREKIMLLKFYRKSKLYGTVYISSNRDDKA